MLSLFISERKIKYLTLVLAPYGAESYRYSFPKVLASIRHLFQYHTESNITVIHFQN